ncbi:type II secretion system protein GspL [Caballeronia mineralivorans]|uniref:type II secretion system protein GspL n=1 Tax=Caballeronia mineralivorans TaxID=2010198 RepID=UPI002B0034A0|nr:type II secretion system protein GspL [Caballeronia mineralivorans]MEA3097063.1 ral secretion pathway protein [Caballeronia mineralivorans]
MSTLIVLLPPRDPAVRSEEWNLPELPFLLLDKRNVTQRAGRAALALLPRASATVLIVAARDLLLTAAQMPPLKGPRLRQALPNVVEDQLIQDPQTCHIAVDPVALASGRRVLAVIDRGWFRFVLEAFANKGHRNVKAVPAMRCLPRHESAADIPDPFVAGVLGDVLASAPVLLGGDTLRPSESATSRVEIAIARGEHAALGEGLAIPAGAVTSTLNALAGAQPITLYALRDVPGAEPHLASARSALPDAQPLTFETLARNALANHFDLCQFEFAAQPWRVDRASMRRLRVPVALLAGALVVSMIGINIQWMQLARQRDAINAQMTETLLNTFPKTTVVLDAPDQMSRQLDRLRLVSGQLSPADFLSLADALARALGPIPVNGIAGLDYHDRRLEVSFKPETKVDPGWQRRLAANGLAGAIDSNTGKWSIRSAQ